MYLLTFEAHLYGALQGRVRCVGVLGCLRLLYLSRIRQIKNDHRVINYYGIYLVIIIDLS